MKLRGIFIILLLAVMSLVGSALSEEAADYALDYGVKFYMSTEQVKTIEAQNNHPLQSEYEGTESFQLYYNENIFFRSLRCNRLEYDFDLKKKQLFQFYYTTKGGAVDYQYMKSVLSRRFDRIVPIDEFKGRTSLLFKQKGDDNYVEAVHMHWGYFYGIDLWYTPKDTVFAVFYVIENPASYGLSQKYYSEDINFSFNLFNDVWDAKINNTDVELCNINDPTSYIEYSRIDYWEEIKEKPEVKGLSRADIWNDYLEDILLELGEYTDFSNVRTKVFNNISFLMADFQMDYSNDGKSHELRDMTIAMTMQEGYVHMFALATVTKHEEMMPLFEDVLNSVSFIGR